jgi:hypothetical protein
MVQKIVVNRTYGGFGLSDEAVQEYCKRKGIDDINDFHYYDVQREDPVLVSMMEEFGPKFVGGADRTSRALKVVEVPDGVLWNVCEYDGLEWVAEKHRVWE